MNQFEFERLIQGCDNVIFDYGGVFVDIHHQRTIDAFNALSRDPEEKVLFGKNEQAELFGLYETGKMSSESFMGELRRVLGAEHPSESIAAAWNAMLGGHNRKRSLYLKRLAKTKRVFMLSNINSLHERFLRRSLEKEGMEDFYADFEKVYFSHAIGKRKPDREAFEHVLEENGLVPGLTAFLDDTEGHVEAARELGLRGIHLNPANSFIAAS